MLFQALQEPDIQRFVRYISCNQPYENQGMFDS